MFYQFRPSPTWRMAVLSFIGISSMILKMLYLSNLKITKDLKTCWTKKQWETVYHLIIIFGVNIVLVRVHWSWTCPGQLFCGGFCEHEKNNCEGIIKPFMTYGTLEECRFNIECFPFTTKIWRVYKCHYKYEWFLRSSDKKLFYGCQQIKSDQNYLAWAQTGNIHQYFYLLVS